MIFQPIIYPDASIDLYAGNQRTYEQLKPLWNALTEMNRQGIFYVSSRVRDDGANLQRIKRNKLDGFAPLAVCSYHDLHDVYVIGEERPFIMIEFEHATDMRGLGSIISLFLCHEDKTYQYRKIASKQVIQFDDDHDATRKIIDFIKGKEPELITEINGHSVGLIYMAFGEKAKHAVKRSLATLRRHGYIYPVAIIGDFDQSANWVNGHGCNIRYEGETPFDISQRKNFQFRAGRIKPKICELTPFDYTLYIDADTRFIQPIQSGFELLNQYDVAVTDEKLSLSDLYNKKLAGWELNMVERDVTMVELNDLDGEQKFVNSGVIFFRKNKKTKRLFAEWHRQWLRFQEWDEQLSLMRAINKQDDLNIKHLPVTWNAPHLTEETIIFHNYGRGEVRLSYG